MPELLRSQNHHLSDEHGIGEPRCNRLRHCGSGDCTYEVQNAGNDDGALALLSSACSISCGEVVVTAFAASQATSVSRLCDAGLPGNRSGVVGEIFQVNADGGGGGASSQ